MIRAKRAGLKTKTRRVIKYQPELTTTGLWHVRNAHGGEFVSGDDREIAAALIDYVPYSAGDRLWVKEAYRVTSIYDDLKPSQIPPGVVEAGAIRYEADDGYKTAGKYRHARFMPRWASRSTLTVIDVRVQQLLDISEEDAKAEGFAAAQLNDGFGPRDIGGGYTIESPGTYASAGGMFQIYWAKLNPKWDGFSSPWVFALTFTVEHRNIDALATTPAREPVA